MINKKEFYKKTLKFIVSKLNENNFIYGLGNYAAFSAISYELKYKILASSLALFQAASITDMLSIRKDIDEYKSYLLYLENMQDKDYLKLKKKYDTYVKRLASHIKDKNFTDPLDIGLYFDAMLYSSNLSIGNDFKYYRIKRDNDGYYPGILGARIVSGYGVCRNMSAFLVDLYKELGYDAVDVHVNTKKVELGGHAACLVKSDAGSFIIDPTWRTVAEIDYSSKKSKEIISYYDNNVYNQKYILKGYNDNNYCYYAIDPYFINKYSKSRIFDKDYVNERYKLVANTFNITRFYDEFGKAEASFYENNKDLMQEISEIEQSLTLPKIKKKVK